ncbi:MAG: hypothetical protein KBT68_07680, partial [bacterium]|nr:hypothetical protein [Candidatus Colisoma equi]
MIQLLCTVALSIGVALTDGLARTPYGICAHPTRGQGAVWAELCGTLAENGIRHVRVDWDWAAIERRPGQFRWEAYDEMLAVAESKSIQVLPVLGLPPYFAQPPAAHTNELAQFVREVYKRYGMRLPVFEVCNEVSSHGMPATDYFKILKATYEAVKSVDSRVQVAICGFSGFPLGYIENLYKQGAARYFDIMNGHPYTYYRGYLPEGGLERSFEEVRALMAKYGDAHKPIFATEIGWPVRQPKLRIDGLLKAALKLAEPERDGREWRMLFVYYGPDGAEPNDFVRKLPEGRLPAGAQVRFVSPRELAASLTSERWANAVVLPFNDTWPSGVAEELRRFVAEGGTLIKFGGAPLYYGYENAVGGGYAPRTPDTSERDRRGLHFDYAANWVDGRYPRKADYRPTAALQALLDEPITNAFQTHVGISSAWLAPGDEFVPLLTAAPTNGLTPCAGALIRYKDMKGKVVISTVFEPGMDGADELTQAKMVPRSNLISIHAGVSRLYWYQASDANCKGSGDFAILHGGFDGTLALKAYRTLTKWRPSGSRTVPGEFKNRETGLYHARWIRPDGRRAGALWTVMKPHAEAVDLGTGEFLFGNYLGRRLEVPKTDDGWQVPVSDEVVYYVERSHRPETWFHLIGGNVSKEGLTADLEAIKDAGIGGIQLFHGQMGEARAWPGVSEQIPCLSEKWDDMIAHVGNECARLGLTFKMQNCPGWSMSGGPWITPENAMRELVYSRTDVASAGCVRLPVPEKGSDRPAERDYRDLFVLAFPTPKDDEPEALRPVRVDAPSPDVRIYEFAQPVCVRSVELPSTSALNHDRTYDPAASVTISAMKEDGDETIVTCQDLPAGNWQDNRENGMRQTLALDEAVSRRWKVSVRHRDPIGLKDARLYSGARLNHWEGLAGWTLRGLVDRGVPKQDPACWIRAAQVFDLTERMSKDGTLSFEPPDGGFWTILRIGHVNGLCRNGPAPAEATGWECSKLSKGGIEANYRSYIGRLAKGPVKGRLAGLVVDSWECYRQNWTEGLDLIFRTRIGYELKSMLPAVFGWVMDDPRTTEEFLRDWRGLLGKLVEENYYGRLSELAHADGLTVQYETAFGDALAGDLLAFWKYADVPMCEFWRPFAQTGVGSHDFKPVKPCVSAAHVYGHGRVAAEALTNCALTWDEKPGDFKTVIDRHFARGVTHLVFHTYTHNPQVGFKRPGTSFGYFIGTPFIRGQDWWKHMRAFTDYVARCGEFLEAGKPVVDVLRVLGDGLGHKPSERDESFGNRFKDDYINKDALMNRLSVRDGRLVLPDGMEYAVLWIPEGTYLDAESAGRIGELERRGAKVVR